MAPFPIADHLISTSPSLCTPACYVFSFTNRRNKKRRSARHRRRYAVCPASKNHALIVSLPARGIGKAIALRLAADGFAVAVNDVPLNSTHLQQVVQEITDLGTPSFACIADVTVEEEVMQMIEQVVAHFPTGHLDVVSSSASFWNFL